MLADFDFVELLMIGAGLYLGLAKNPVISNRIAVMVIAAALLLIFILGGAQDNPLNSFNLVGAGINWTFLLVSAVLLGFIYYRSEKGESVRTLWLILSGWFFVSASETLSIF